MGNKHNSFAFLQVSIDKEQPFRLEIQLFDNEVPKTAKNFRSICQGCQKDGKKLTYKNSYFHRIVPDFAIQGGDITSYNGKGGYSIYGSSFKDQNFKIKHVQRGYLSMANCGKNTNNSQFFINLNKNQTLDGKHVVFGKITKGMQNLNKMQQKGNQFGHTSCPVQITNCGIL